MARMSSCHMCCLFTVLLFILVSLGLIVTSIVTDFWYSADGNDSQNATVRRDFTYHFGMWRKCYENGIPTCKYLFQANIQCWTTIYGRIQRGTPLGKSQKYRGFSNTGPDPLKITKLPSQHSVLNHHRPTSGGSSMAC